MLALFVATARGSTQNGVCMTHFTNLTYAEAVIIYSTLYDFVLLVFTIIGLSKVPPSSALWKKLVKQGVVYFIVNLAANLVLLVLFHLNLNTVMNSIFAMPTAYIWSVLSLWLSVEIHDLFPFAALFHQATWYFTYPSIVRI
ncbi:hypothetical protein BDR07DRAFT_367322 [Suillus spraguei]|nr:hypothetical protein BDR07DRAFT_367322 [Suillus spraguei]